MRCDTSYFIVDLPHDRRAHLLEQELTVTPGSPHRCAMPVRGLLWVLGHLEVLLLFGIRSRGGLGSRYNLLWHVGGKSAQGFETYLKLIHVLHVLCIQLHNCDWHHLVNRLGPDIEEPIDAAEVTQSERNTRCVPFFYRLQLSHSSFGFQAWLYYLSGSLLWSEGDLLPLGFLLTDYHILQLQKERPQSTVQETFDEETCLVLHIDNLLPDLSYDRLHVRD